MLFNDTVICLIILYSIGQGSSIHFAPDITVLVVDIFNTIKRGVLDTGNDQGINMFPHH